MTPGDELRLIALSAGALAIDAGITAVKARIAAFEAANHHRRSIGSADAYGDEHYFAAETELQALAAKATAFSSRMSGELEPSCYGETRTPGAHGA